MTLDGDKTVRLTYAALPGKALDPARVRGTLEGWTLGTGELGVELLIGGTLVDATTPTISSSGYLDAGLPTPDIVSPFLGDCTFQGKQTARDFGFELAFLEVLSPLGDDLGHIAENTTDGREVLRIYSDTTARFKGTLSCGGSERWDLDINVVRGWNGLSVTEVGSGQYRFRNFEAGTRTVLSFKRATERADVLFSDNSPLTLRPGEQASRGVTVGQTGGISGQITLETDVPGVTITPSTLNLPALGGASLNRRSPGVLSAVIQPQALSTFLTFTVGQEAKSYVGPLNVIVKQGGQEVGRGTLHSFSLRAPSVSVYIPEAYNAVSVYQGGTSGLKVSLSSVEGFSGNTTLTVEGLPAGVTAPSVTVQVTPGTNTTVTIPLTAAAEAPLGGTTVRVTSPDLGNFPGANSVPVSVRPARTSIGSVASSLARGSEGVWIAGESRYDSVTSASTTQLTRYVGVQAVTTVTLPVSYPQLLTLRNGDFLVVGSGTNVYRVADTGTVTPLPNPVSNGLGDTAVDDQGRVWFVRRTFNSMGEYNSVLAHWSPETGEVVVVDSSHKYGDVDGKFTASNGGKVLVYLPAYFGSGTPVRIDPLTGVVSDLGVALTAQNDSVAVSTSGTLWFTQSSVLRRLNTDGSVTTFEGVSVNRLTGFDRRDANTLWGTDYSSVQRIDADKVAVTSTHLGEVGSTVTLNGGGLGAVTNEYEYGTGRTQFYLSFLK